MCLLWVALRSFPPRPFGNLNACSMFFYYGGSPIFICSRSQCTTLSPADSVGVSALHGKFAPVQAESGIEGAAGISDKDNDLGGEEKEKKIVSN